LLLSAYNASRGIDKAMITTLATGEYLTKGESVLITGSTGCGKSFLVSALGHQACVQGYKVAYFNIHKLMQKTKMARIEGTIYKFFEKIAKTNLLILDDFGLVHLEKQQQLDLMELIEDRHGRASTIIASQLPVASWFDVIELTLYENRAPFAIRIGLGHTIRKAVHIVIDEATEEDKRKLKIKAMEGEIIE